MSQPEFSDTPKPTYSNDFNFIHELMSVGLTHREAKIFTCIYNLGPQPSSIIAKHLSMKRTTVYHNLQKLVAKGFIHSSKKSNTTYFHLSPLKEAISQLEEEQSALKAKQDSLQKIATQKLKRYAESKLEYIHFREHHGPDALKKLHLTALKHIKKEILIFLPPNRLSLLQEQPLFQRFLKKLSRQKLYARILCASNPEFSWSNHSIHPNLQVRSISFEHLSLQPKVELNILHDRVLVFNQKFACEIHSPDLTAVQRSTFEMLWQNSSPLPVQHNRQQFLI